LSFNFISFIFAVILPIFIISPLFNLYFFCFSPVFDFLYINQQEFSPLNLEEYSSSLSIINVFGIILKKFV
jgi:hypothetical protein